MTNFSAGLIYLIASFLASIVLIQSYVRRKESTASLWFSLLCVTNGVWGLLCAIYFLAQNDSIAYIAYVSRYGFIALSSMLTYLFMLKLIKHKMYHAPMLIFLLSLPAIILVMSLTNPWHHIMYKDIFLTTLGGLRSMDYQYNWGFYFHCFVSYASLTAAAVIMYQQYFRLPRNYRFPILIMFIAVGVSAVYTLCIVFNVFSTNIDLTPVITLASQVIFYYALYNAHSYDMLFTSRDTIFENLGYPILVIDTDGRIIDYNSFAFKAGQSSGLNYLQSVLYKDFYQKWLLQNKARVFAEDDSIVSINENGKDAHYQVIKHPIHDEVQGVIGEIIEIKSITPIMTMIHKLQETAYYDNLTGLYNRHSYNLHLEELNRPEYLPLCIMVSDVNGLKLVNDSLGHTKGDLLLQFIAQTQKKLLPPKAILARFGGDEFLCLIPNTSEIEAATIAEKINHHCNSISNPEFKNAGLALGYKIKYHMQEDVAQLTHEADIEMYKHKKNRRTD